MSTQETLLTRETMDQLAQVQGVTLNTKIKSGHVHVYIRDHGVLLYLGYLHVLERLSEAAFTARIAGKLAKALEEA